MPSTITAIRPSKPSPARSVIVVGGKAVATLPVKRIEAMGLAVGIAWTDELADKVAGARRFDLALRDALRRINRQPMSRARLRQKLIAAGHGPAAADLVLDEVQRIGALDDEALARNLAEELRQKHDGPELIRAKLRQRGLGDEVIGRALADSTAAADPSGAALALAQKKLAAMKSLEPATQRRRLHAALARRGFNADTIESVVQSLLGESTDEST